jgi:hypothetical protein
MSGKSVRGLGEVNQFHAIGDPTVLKLLPYFAQNTIRKTANWQNPNIDVRSPAGLASGHRAEKVDLDVIPLQPIEKKMADCFQMPGRCLSHAQINTTSKNEEQSKPVEADAGRP